MSKSEHELNERPVPTTGEIETLLMNTRPRPTARLRQKLAQSPWQVKDGEMNVIRLRKLELLGSGAAVLLVAVVAFVIFSQWTAANETPGASGPGAAVPGAAPLTQTRDVVPATPQVEETAVPATVTPIVPEGSVAWTTTLPGTAGELGQPGGGIAFDASHGRLFVAGGLEGIHQVGVDGGRARTIAIVDPETAEAVFVYDVAWSQFLWLGPPERGLVALTKPFASGEYLHLVDPDSGSILHSFTHNGNIALPFSEPPVGERLPTQLAASGEGELFVNRLFTVASGTEADTATDFHYLLRMVLDGRILNPLLAGEEPAVQGQAEMIAALAYQSVDGLLYAAIRHGEERIGIVGKYDLNGTPRLLGGLEEAVVRWQEDVALAVDEQGHLFAAVDGPGYIVEVDQNDEVVQLYGFRDRAGADGYPAVTVWLPGDMGRPLALAVTPDRRLLFLVDEVEGEIRLTAYDLAGDGGTR